MLISLDWLAEYLPEARTCSGLEQLLTDRGLEVESAARAGPALPGVVAARIIASESVPGTERLKRCTVDAGSGTPVTVACAAPNAAARKTYAYAPPGTTLPDGRAIGNAEVRGIESAGMLCSAAELGLSDGADGIMQLDSGTRPGTPLADALGFGDTVYDIAVTPNRGDWLSMHGVAREIAALLGHKPKPLRVTMTSGSSEERHPAAIDADALEACPRFCALAVTGVNARARTPRWMAERLRRCGVRPVSAIVDITNYAMLALGQPLHAFDRDRLGGPLNVRFAKAGESLELLDGTAVALRPDMLLVCGGDAPAALAGVMGGAASAVSSATRSIVLEAAHFVPQVVRGRTRELNLSSEAAYRFERGVDPQLPPLALALAARLVKRICGGRPGTMDEAGALPAKAAPVTLPDGKAGRVLGFDPGPTETARILRRLGFAVTRNRSGKKLAAVPPSWRFDASCAEDLIEEVVRVLGYEQIPTTMPQMQGQFLAASSAAVGPLASKQRLAGEGFSETVTYSFVPPAWEKDFYANEKPLLLTNPLAENASAMRTGLLASLADRAVYNFNRRQRAVRIFELSRCFPPGDVRQPRMLAVLACGPVAPDHWAGSNRELDFFDLKGTLARMLPGMRLDYAPDTSHPALHPARAARILHSGKQLGHIGEIHPRLAELYGLPHPCAVFELDFEACAAVPSMRQARRLSKLPLVRRDLALVMDAGVAAGKLVESVRMLALPELYDVAIFDVYAGSQLTAGQKSIGLRLTLQGETANLIDERIDAIVDAVAGALATQHGAAQRS